MSAILRAAMHVRVRRLFLEELASGQPTDFIDVDQVPDEVDEDWDEATQEQHLIVLDNAEKSGRLEDYDNKYLQRYLERTDYSLVRGQYEYGPIPENVARVVKVEIDGLRAIRKSPSEDRLIRTWPSQYGPGPGEAFWIMLSHGFQSPLVAGDRTRVLRLYVYGMTVNLNQAVPVVSQGTASMTFYRLVDPISYNSPPVTYTDTEDPWGEGPVVGTAARLQAKAQQLDKSMAMRRQARDLANLIIPNPNPQPQGVPQQ